jgi:chromosome segregation ATPase
MKLKALRRLEKGVEELAGRFDKAVERHSQLSSALAKSREQVERLKAELAGYRSERKSTKKKVDALLKRFDSLGVDWEQAE